MPIIPVPILTIGLLLLSNIFMTFAWYGHLKFRDSPLLAVIFVSWGIAFFEYCLQVPANRYGYASFSAVQLKTIQEVITLLVFCFFSIFTWANPCAGIIWQALPSSASPFTSSSKNGSIFTHGLLLAIPRKLGRVARQRP